MKNVILFTACFFVLCSESFAGAYKSTTPPPEKLASILVGNNHDFLGKRCGEKECTYYYADNSAKKIRARQVIKLDNNIWINLDVHKVILE